MVRELKQSTAATIKFGPLVDDTDGKTAETGLSIAQADIRLSKNGGDAAQSNNSAGATHDEAGYYDIPLDTTDTNTLGSLEVMISKSGALPRKEYFEVVTANYWDSKYSTDKLQVDVVEISGDSGAADNLESACDGNTYNIGGGAVVAASVTAKTGYELSSAYDAAKTAASQTSVYDIDSVLDAIKAKADNLPATPAAVGSKMDIADSPSSLGLGAITAAVWSRLLTDISTTGSIGKLIKDYLDAAISSRLAAAGYTAPPTVSAIADQVFDEDLSGHTATGSAGKALSEAVAPTVEAIDAQLSASHGASAWGASAVGSITYPDPDDDPQPFLDPDDDPLAGVKIEAYSDEDRTTLVDVQITDINGMFAFHLDAGTYYFRAILAGYANFEWSVELTA